MIEIIPFAEKYRQDVVDVILPILQSEFDFAVTLDQQPDLLDIPNFYQKDNGNFWIALSDGVVVGTISLLIIGNGRGALRRMFVKESFRGKKYGLARSLLDALLQWCLTIGVREVYLGTTEKFLAAHRFYEKNGFTEIQKPALPSRFPGMTGDTKFYKFTLREEAAQHGTAVDG